MATAYELSPRARVTAYMGEIFACATLFLALGANGCGKHVAETKTAAPPPVPTVEVLRPERRTIERIVQQPAWIEAFEETPMYAKISGYVETIDAEIGQRVEKDHVLAKLWVPELGEEFKQKEGQVAQARLEIVRAETALEVARANYETMKSLITEARAARKRTDAQYDRWKSELHRMEELSDAKVIDSQSRDETKNQFLAAEATRDEAQFKVNTATAALKESEAKRDNAEANLPAVANLLALAETDLRRVRALLAYTEIKAPYDGVVTERHVHTGHFLQPSPAGKAVPLFVVVRTDRVRAFLDVPEADAVLVLKGATAHLRVPVLNDREFTGAVAGTSWSLDPNQRTLRTEVDFDNPEETLRPGMYAHASIPLEQTGAMSLPSIAVLIRDGESFCYCVENDKAVRTQVRLGARHSAGVEVLKKLVRPDAAAKARWEDFTGEEEIIVSNLAELSDGQAVRVDTGGKMKVAIDPSDGHRTH